ncbi:MAG TPA: polyhydroxyalkanoate depolymerase [Rhizomicrobium sp.]|jgi:polyhydroxyalkanoate depolymerase
MIYQAFQAQTDLLAPLRATAGMTNAFWREPLLGPIGNTWLRTLAAGAELIAQTRVAHDRPAFGIEQVNIGGVRIPVTEEIIAQTSFGALLHFRKARSDANQPRVLLVAPMAGHFATLLRDTVETLLPDHDVYITDWFNARDIPRGAGRFGFDEYIAHLIQFLDRLGPGTHVIAVCQPCAALLAAVAVMADQGHRAQPRSMTLMAGPIDTRISPTSVNQFAKSHPIDWFERHLISVVPARHRGAHRRVYPGFMQLIAFLSMNLPRHLRAHFDLLRDRVSGDDAKAQHARDFYDEYFAVLDLPAEFYLETVSRVFQDHLLPRRRLVWRGEPVDTRAIRATALLTIEGERDDICAPGQTAAAQELCERVPSSRRLHHLQPRVGHYGVFAGRGWRSEIYPRLRSFIAASQ